MEGLGKTYDQVMIIRHLPMDHGSGFPAEITLNIQFHYKRRHLKKKKILTEILKWFSGRGTNLLNPDIALRPNPLLSLPANVARCRYIPLPYEECAATAALELPTYIILLLWYTCLLSV